jgi:hypothetical protein
LKGEPPADENPVSAVLDRFMPYDAPTGTIREIDWCPLRRDWMMTREFQCEDGLGSGVRFNPAPDAQWWLQVEGGADGARSGRL